MSETAVDMRDRQALFAALGERRFDVAIIGGGITGAGVARDAAMRGLSVALVEAHDFASGTSSRSSKMIHGGLRYLAQGDLGLVREAAGERKAVQAIAPHLAVETPFVIGARNQAGIAKLRAGLWTFEKLGGVPRSRSHEVWSRAALAKNEPAMRSDDLAGAVVYPEYLTNDARLTLANIRSAAGAGAVVVNYARAEALVTEAGKAVAIDVADRSADASGRRAMVSARVIVNAAGPWVDAVRALEQPGVAAKLTLTRGVHVVVPRVAAPVGRTLIAPAGGGRSIFIVPKGAATYIGTTDTFYAAAETWPPITPEDVAYLLEAANARLAGAPLGFGNIMSVWSGLRPLVGQPGKSASEISRHDEIWDGPAGVISIAGGKLTAYRRMAERVVDKVEKAMGYAPRACRTADEPLPGGESEPGAVRAALTRRGVDEAEAERLVELYGAEAPAAVGGPGAEAARAVTHEGALTLEDYWVRRSGRAWFERDGRLRSLASAVAVMAQLLGWSAERSAAELAACRERRAADLAFTATGLGR